MTGYDPRRPTPTYRPSGLNWNLYWGPERTPGAPRPPQSPRLKANKRKARDATRCHWCRFPFTEAVPRTKEHLIPRSQGGGKGANIVGACGPCNHARGTIPAAEWKAAVRQVMADHPDLEQDRIGLHARRLWVRLHRDALPPDPGDWTPAVS